MTSHPVPSLSDAEWRVMHALWRHGPCGLAVLSEALKDAGWSRHALISFLKRLEAKGAVLIESDSRPSRYSALIDEASAIKKQTKSLLDTVYGNNPLLMAHNLIEVGALTDSDIRELMQILQKKEDR